MMRFETQRQPIALLHGFGYQKAIKYTYLLHKAQNLVKFITYVDYLVNNQFTQPSAKTWVDEIRDLGNEANYEVVIMNEAQTKTLYNLLK